MASELIEFSNVIADIYDAAVEPALWRQALASITAYVGGSSAVLYWHDAATEKSEVLHLFNENPEYTRLYFEKYLPMNPMFPAGAFYDVGVVSSTNDIMPVREFVETRFYKEWVKPQGIGDALSVNLEKGTTRASLLNVRMDISLGFENGGARRRMALLVPHLQRAVSIGRLFDQQKATTEELASALDHVEAAVVLVGADGAISFVNEPATKMLGEAKLVHARDNALRAVDENTDRLLREVFQSAASGDTSVGLRGVAVPLTPGSQERWFAHVLPLTSGRRQEAGRANRAVAAIFIRKGAPNVPLSVLEAIAKDYKLTASEVRVLDVLLKVKGVRQIADTLGLSQATVKTHLQSLFRKTGSSRQSDLVRLIGGH